MAKYIYKLYKYMYMFCFLNGMFVRFLLLCVIVANTTQKQFTYFNQGFYGMIMMKMISKMYEI